MWVNSKKNIDYREELLDKLYSVPLHRQTSYKKFVNYIENILLDYDDPDVIEIKCYIGHDYFNIDIMINLGFFNFVAYRPKSETVGHLAWEMQFKHSYMPHDKILEYSEKITGSGEGIFKTILDQWHIIIKDSVKSLCNRAKKMITVEDVLNSIQIDEVTLNAHIKNLIKSTEAFLDTNIEDHKKSFYNKIQYLIDEYDWSDLYARNPYNYSSNQTTEPKERLPVPGFIYLVKCTNLNLYGFRKSKGDIHPDLHAQLNFSRQKHPLETVSYFKSEDVNKMFLLVKKQFESKKVEIDYKKWDDLSQLNWYDLNDEDLFRITESNFSDYMQEVLVQGEKRKNEFIFPGGYVMLFRDKHNAYYLRSTGKANPQGLIWRGNHESAKPVIGFLTKDLEYLKTYFHQNFGDKRDYSENGNKEKYFFDDDDISQRIQSLSLNEELQIVEVIQPQLIKQRHY